MDAIEFKDTATVDWSQFGTLIFFLAVLLLVAFLVRRKTMGLNTFVSNNNLQRYQINSQSIDNARRIIRISDDDKTYVVLDSPSGNLLLDTISTEGIAVTQDC